MTYDEMDEIVEKIADHDDESIVENVVERISKDYFIIDKEAIAEIFKDTRDYKIYEYLYENSEHTEYNELKNYADSMYFMVKNLINIFGIEDDE